MNKKSLSYILNQLGEEDNPYGAVSPPIYQTSTYCFKSFADYRETLKDEVNRCLYTRGNNPTVNLAELKLAALEGAERAKLVSSGSSAISHAIMAFVKSGDHVVAVRDSYSWCINLLEKYLPRFDISYTFVDGTNTDEVLAAIKPETKVIYLESPTSLTFKLQDMEVIAAEAKKRGIKTICDNTWATPIYCNPIKLGIDIVVHSGSKYLGGSSDIVAGVILGSKKDIDLIMQQEFLQLGTTADPFMAWLLIRGLRTLHVRLEAHYKNALAVASFLEQHSKIESVIYPMLPSHPQYELATKLFRGGSGLLAFHLKTGKYSEIVSFVDELKLFRRAVSWGGYESLVFSGAIRFSETDNAPQEKLSLTRLHIGLERSEDLIEDLERALKVIR